MHNNKTISLIPYLSPSNGFFLDINRCDVEEPVEKETEYKFEELFDSDPFCRLMNAGIVSNGKSQVKKFFLLMQKDVYLHPEDELRPVTNPGIERYWQRAFKLYADNDQNQDCLILTGQADRPEQLTVWQPLFFCSRRQIFFHPPCPVCGHTLHLCRDDKILTGMELRPYSTSLKRYLYCPFCHDVAGQSDFFTYDLAKSDPSFVNDRWDLIRKLGRLKPGLDTPDHFPCSDCSEREKCHEPDGPAKNRIKIFNFYPSYMIIFPGDSINAVDFLALVSGASGEQLQNNLADRHQNGRIKCLQASGVLRDRGSCFMFRQSNRFFLETLYLKLNFLTGVFENIIPALQNLRPPDLGLSLDRFWVKLAGRTGLIPHLWNFTVHRIDIGDAGSQSLQIPKNPPSYGFYFLGTIWFFTLLANSRQASSTIYENLQTILEPGSRDPETSTVEFETALHNPVFAPENIFWNSNEAKISESMKSIWQETLKTGWMLLNSHIYHGVSHDIENFQKKLTVLLETVRGMLLPLTGDVEKPAEKTENKEISEKDNQAIYNIINRIGRKWSAAVEDDSVKPDLSRQEPGTGQASTRKMGSDETLIIGNRYGDAASAVPESKEAPTPIQKKKSGFTIKTTKSHEKELKCETIMLSSGIFNDISKGSTGHEKKSAKTMPDLQNDNGSTDFFEDHTLIQQSTGRPEKILSAAGPEFSAVDDFTKTDEIEETLILSRADKNAVSRSRKDDFAETMIQSPGAETQNKTTRSAESDNWPPDIMKNTEKSKISDQPFSKTNFNMDQNFEETKVPVQKDKKEHCLPAENVHAEEDLPETVILSSRPRNRK